MRGLEQDTAGPLPYLAYGDGPPLVFLNGLMFDAGVDADSVKRVSSGMSRAFGGGRRVLCFNRRRGLPRGMTMAALAAEHAEAIRAATGGRADVVGMSTGGSIAQQLAADHADVVRRLVLASTACRLGPLGKELQRRVAARVRCGASRQAFALMTASLVPPGPLQVPVAAAAWVAAPSALPGPADLAALATTIEAEDDFDLARCASPIRAPTLIVGGGRDRFYTRALFAETERLIPDSRLALFERRGHITVTMQPAFAAMVRRFLTAGDIGGTADVRAGA